LLKKSLEDYEKWDSCPILSQLVGAWVAETALEVDKKHL
jgi:hypothetical protein